MSTAPDVGALVTGAREGDARSVARLISLVEDASPLLREAMAALTPYGGRATVIGLTGAPGVGKSTTTNALVTAYRGQGKRVGVLAVDPSSPFSGGALLGDRVRMQDHALDRDVYIRSMASRGHLGGLAWSTPQALRVLDAAGCDVVLVEINEAFASVGIKSMRDLGLTEDTVNVNGGAIALGHPIGMSGARIALHLALELQRRGGGVGAAALCVGGGQGDALVLRVPGAQAAV